MNLYSYCGNNPLNYADPSGLCKGFLSGFGLRSLRNVGIAIGVLAAIGIASVLCPGALAVVGGVLAKVGPALALAGGVMGGAMLAPAITGYDYAGNDLSAYQRGEYLSDAGFIIGGSLYGASQAYGPTASAPAARPDIGLSGGRGGQNVKNLVGPPNSAVRGSTGRAFVTNEKGQVILDVTSARAKPVIPGSGFGPKRAPTAQELDLIRRLHGG